MSERRRDSTKLDHGGTPVFRWAGTPSIAKTTTVAQRRLT
jgi:hypothetical protein